jgi:DNA-binding CsgD family transcriptional regulator
MDLVVLIFYFVSLSVAGAMVVTSHGLVKKYTYKFLNYYFFYLIFFCLYGFLNFTGRLLVTRIFEKSPYTFTTASQVVALIAIPAMITGVYFKLSWIYELLGKVFPGWLKITYWGVQALVLMGFFYGVAKLVELKDFSVAIPILHYFSFIEYLINYLVIFEIYFGMKYIEDKARKRLARNLGYMYTASLSVMIIIGEFIRLPLYIYPDGSFFLVVFTLLFFSLNIPPLFYLKVFLKKHHAELGLQSLDPEGVNHFYDRFDITKREQEIIERLIKGKTNEEIGDELFISSKTVKNNISTIYRKTGVKNRVQLTSLIKR